MSFSFELQDEVQSLQEIESYEIPHEHDLETEDLVPLLEGTSCLKAQITY